MTDAVDKLPDPGGEDLADADWVLYSVSKAIKPIVNDWQNPLYIMTLISRYTYYNTYYIYMIHTHVICEFVYIHI